MAALLKPQYVPMAPVAPVATYGVPGVPLNVGSKTRAALLKARTALLEPKRGFAWVFDHCPDWQRLRATFLNVEHDIEALFGDCDVDRNHYVTVQEVMMIYMHHLGRILPASEYQELEECIREYADDDGRIDLANFKQMMKDLDEEFAPMVAQSRRYLQFGWSIFFVIVGSIVGLAVYDMFLAGVWIFSVMIAFVLVCICADHYMMERKLQDAANGMIFLIGVIIALLIFTFVRLPWNDNYGVREPATTVGVLANVPPNLQTLLLQASSIRETGLGWHLCHKVFTEAWSDPNKGWAADEGFMPKVRWQQYYAYLQKCSETDPLAKCSILDADAYNSSTTSDYTFLWYNGCQYFIGMQQTIKLMRIHGAFGGIALAVGIIVKSGGIVIVSHTFLRVPFKCTAHKALGVLYAVSGLGASTTGLALSIKRGSSQFNTLCVSIFSALHWVTFLAAVVGPYLSNDWKATHQRWWTCNYFVIFGAVSLRLWYLVVVEFVTHFPDLAAQITGFRLDDVWQRAYDLTLILPIVTQVLIMLHFLGLGNGSIFTQLPGPSERKEHRIKMRGAVDDTNSGTDHESPEETSMLSEETSS